MRCRLASTGRPAALRSSSDDLREQYPTLFFGNGKLIYGSAPKLLAAHWYLRDAIARYIEEKAKNSIAGDKVLDALLSGFLNAFQIVVVQLGKNDDAQTIFAEW